MSKVAARAVDPPRRVRPAVYALVAAALASCLVSIVPLGGITRGVGWPMVALAIAGVSAAFLVPVGRDWSSLLRWRVAWAAAAVLAWSLASALLSPRVFSGLFGADESGLGWLVMAVSVIVLLAAAFHSAELRPVLTSIAPAVIVVEAVFVAFQNQSGAHPGGTFTNSTYLAEVLVLVTPLIAIGVTRSASWKGRGWRLALVLLSLVTLVASVARFSAVLLAIALAFWAVTWVRQWFAVRTRVAVAWVVGAGALVFVAAFAFAGSRISVASWSFWKTRVAIWDLAWRAVSAKPIAGYGPDGFALAGMRVTGAGFFEAWGIWPVAADPHNVVLWVAVSVGLVGLALFVWMGVEIVRDWAGRATDSAVFTAAPFAVGVSLYVLSALAAPAALQTVPLALLVLGASLSPGAAPAGARSDQKTAAGSWALRIAAVVLAALVGAYGATLLSVSRTIGQPPPKTVEAAADTWRFDPLLNYWASLTWGYAGQQDPSLLNSKPDLVAIQRAVALEPTNPIYQTELARTLGFYGMPSDQVLAAFAKAVQLAPNDPEARAAYAEYLIFLKDLPAARKQLDAGETLARSSEVYRVEGLYYRALGDPGKAAQFENMAGEIRASLGFTDLPLMGGQ